MSQFKNNETFHKGELVRIKELTRCYLNYTVDNSVEFNYMYDEIKLEESTILRFISYDNDSRLFIPKVQPFFAEVVSDGGSSYEGRIVYLTDKRVERYSVNPSLTSKRLPLI